MVLSTTAFYLSGKQSFHDLSLYFNLGVYKTVLQYYENASLALLFNLTHPGNTHYYYFNFFFLLTSK